MTATALLTHLRTRGVAVCAVGSQLELTVPRGDRLTADLLAQVRALKPELLGLLGAETELYEERAAVREYDGGLSRPVAERLARRDVERMRGTPSPDPVALDHLTELLDPEPSTARMTPIPPAEERAVIAYIAEIDVKAPARHVEAPNPIEATPAPFGIHSGRGAAGRRQR